MQRPRLCVLCGLSLLFLAGCGESATQVAERRLVGRWKLDSSSLTNGNPLLAMVASTLKAEFDFRTDRTGTFEGSFQANETFTWKVTRVDGTAVYLGRTDKPQETKLVFTDDNTVTVPSTDPEKMPANLTFRRVVK